MWIDREIEGLLARRARERPVIVLTGGRQTGKTSLVQRLFPGHEFVSLDLPSEAEQAERDARGFLARHPPPLVVDEIQYAPGLFRHLKIEVDRHRDATGQFILTGSQHFTLMRAVSESLAGRADILELALIRNSRPPAEPRASGWRGFVAPAEAHGRGLTGAGPSARMAGPQPQGDLLARASRDVENFGSGLEGLSWHEIRAARPELRVEDVLVRGGFPELYAHPEIDAAGFYRSYVATYLERDLRQLLNVTRLRDYERFLRACALRTAQLLKRADLARGVGISGSTAAEWLSILQASGPVALLEPWFSNRAKSLVRTPKLYLADSGLCAFLVGIRGAADLLASPLAGPLRETLVFSEIRRRQVSRHGGWTLNFWRDRTKEADFLRHRGGRFDLADAKWTASADARDAALLERVAAELLRSRVDRLAVICRCGNPYPIDGGVEALPLEGASIFADRG